MRIAILGGGSGRHAAAAGLSEAGDEARLWCRDVAAMRPVVNAGAIVLKDSHDVRKARLARVTVGGALS